MPQDTRGNIDDVLVTPLTSHTPRPVRSQRSTLLGCVGATGASLPRELPCQHPLICIALAPQILVFDGPTALAGIHLGLLAILYVTEVVSTRSDSQRTSVVESCHPTTWSFIRANSGVGGVSMVSSTLPFMLLRHIRSHPSECQDETSGRKMQ